MKAVGGRKLVRNVVWNLLGTGAPLLAAIVAIPLLIGGLGAARFGVLTLAWMVVGYFSLFDLGLGRALTKLVAEKIGAGEHARIPTVVWNALMMMGGFGIAGALFIAGLSPWFVGSALEIPELLKPETQTAFYYLAASVPIVVTSTGLRGVLEAHQRFDVVNIIRLPLGILTFLGPLAVLPFSDSIADMVLILVVGRVIAWLSNFLACWVLFPELRRRVGLDRKIIRRLLSFGGWMTVSNITAPLLLYLGRILIVVMISAEAVAYFVTPYEVISKLLIVPGVLVGVLFPLFSQLFQSDSTRVVRLYRKAMNYMLIVMLPIVIFVYSFAEMGLEWWINEEFSQNGFLVAQILAVGVLINSFGHLSQAVIQAYGRPDVTAKLHVAELFLYVPYLWFLTAHFGINGAAAAWTIRVTISTLALFYLAKRCTSGVMLSDTELPNSV